MSDTRDPATDQVLPTVNDRPFVQDLVVADIETRKQLGIRKYGTALQSGNGRDMLLDAYEEALDLAVYLRGAIDERDHAASQPTGLGETGGEHEDDLRSRLACVVEATYWDRPYDERIAAIRGMCDLTTDGMSPIREPGNG